MSQRLSRVNELLKREISACIEKSFEFPNILVTVHDVDTAQDLKAAKVFIGVIGGEGEIDRVSKKLNSKHGVIQGVVMKRVGLRNTPRLTFVADDSVERGVRVLNILEELGDIETPDEESESDGK